MTEAEWDLIKHFKASEFDSKDAPGSGFANMDFNFVKKLDELREKWGLPLTVQSGYRTITHNALVGGVPDSAHTKGLAADIGTPNLTIAIKLAIAAARVGFVRIGVDLKGGFIHVDSDTSLPQFVTWTYHPEVDWA